MCSFWQFLPIFLRVCSLKILQVRLQPTPWSVGPMPTGPTYHVLSLFYPTYSYLRPYILTITYIDLRLRPCSFCDHGFLMFPDIAPTRCHCPCSVSCRTRWTAVSSGCDGCEKRLTSFDEWQRSCVADCISTAQHYHIYHAVS